MGIKGQHVKPEVMAEAVRRLRAGEVPGHVADDMGISRTTIYKYAADVGTEPPTFTAPKLPSSSLPIEDLIARRREESQRVLAADEARNLIPVQIHTPGPVGLMIFGDPHIDNNGCDFVQLERHLELAAVRSRYLFAGNIGDITDNWIGRLERIYASASTTKADAWRLAEWMMRDAGVSWLFLVKGNHDVAGRATPIPLDWIMRGARRHYGAAHGTRLSLQHPGGAETRVHVRHNFKGGSINTTTCTAQWPARLAFGQRDHILACGHLHYGEDAGTDQRRRLRHADGARLRLQSRGRLRQGRRVQARKPNSSCRRFVIIDPDKPENDSRDRIWCAPSIEEGVEYLDWKRARFEGNARVRVTAR
jgi:hypothetical protein